jgi:hypothetical protein
MKGEYEKGHKRMGDCCGGMHKGHMKEFKLAMLNKKEKILEAKLEFVREMRKMVEKMEMDKD